MKRCVSITVFLSIVAFSVGQEQVKVPVKQDILVGVIRWAGWRANNHHEEYLSKPQWHYRAPFFARIDGDQVTMNQEDQKVMDKEILYAAEAGIDYWSFNYRAWPRDPPADFAWGRLRMHEFHLASPHKDRIRFCLMLQDNLLGPSRTKHPEAARRYDYVKEWDTTASELVAIFKQEVYQKVFTNRPLLYVFAASKFDYFESPKDMKRGLELLAQKSKDAGLGKPYVVAMTWLGNEGGQWFTQAGYDALSGYAAPIHPDIDRKTYSGHPYRMLAEANRVYWDACRITGRPVIPVVNEGWDERPHFVSLNPHYDRPKGAWFSRGTDDEVVSNIEAACRWVLNNQESCESQSILIYAWNEFTEGGWLCPTLEEGSTRLKSVGGVVRRY